MFKFSIRDYLSLAVVYIVANLSVQAILVEACGFDHVVSSLFSTGGTIFALWKMLPRMTGKTFKIVPKD